MSGHTPGPWFVAPDDAEDCPAHAGSGLALVETGRENDPFIAQLVEWNNAHLIAAAPDLLAACEAMVACFADGSVGICDRCDGAGHLGRASDGRYRSCEDCGGHEDSLGTGIAANGLQDAFAKMRAAVAACEGVARG